MSKRTYRTDRHSLFEVHKTKPNTLSKEERRVIWNRLAKKYMKTQGYIGSKIPSSWKWKYGEQSGIVQAFTKGEARSQIKKILNLKTLSDILVLERCDAEQ